MGKLRWLCHWMFVHFISHIWFPSFFFIGFLISYDLAYIYVISFFIFPAVSRCRFPHCDADIVPSMRVLSVFFSLPSRLRAPIGVSPTHRIFFWGEGGGHLFLRQLLLAKVFSTRSHCFITWIAIEFITYVWSCGIWINWDDYVSEYMFAWFRIYGAPLFFSLGLLISCALAYIYIISFFYCPAMLYILS